MSTAKRHYLIAIVPVAAVGIWNCGLQIAALSADAAISWQLTLATGLGIDVQSPETLGAFGLGLVFWLPIASIALATSYFWATIFARLRGRPVDSGWLLHAVIFSLLLPATMPLGFAVLALSFGLVFGSHVFGGTGRYLTHPALLSVVFVTFAYPALLASTAWLPGELTATTWSLTAGGGPDVLPASGTSLVDAFIGREVGAIGATSAGACLLGALYLLATRAVSGAILTGGVAAIVISASLLGELPWTWHLAVGNFAFVLVFIATDPTTQAKSAAGRFLSGTLFGIVTVILRTLDPAHPEGTWAALLLASLAIPLIDRLTTRPRDIDAPAASMAGGH